MAQQNLISIPPFSKGFITENNQLIDVPSYTSDELNCKIYNDGTRGRRFGIDYEPGYVFNTLTIVEEFNKSAFSSFCWNKPGKVFPSLYLIQCGRYITIYKEGERPFSSHEQSYVIDLDKYKINDTYSEFSVTFTDAYGVLYITGENIESFKVTYDGQGTYSTSTAARTSVFSGQGSMGRKGTYCLQFYMYLRGVQVAHRSWSYNSYFPFESAVPIMINEWNDSTLNEGIVASNASQPGPAVTNSFIAFTAPYSDTPDVWNGTEISFRIQAQVVMSSHSQEPWVTNRGVMSGGTTGTITVKEYTEEQFTLNVRDTDGLVDGTEIDGKPLTLSQEHEYNLLNQGWTTANITSFHTTNTYYPTNNIQWFAAKNAKNAAFVPADLLKISFGTTQAPKGHFILNYFQPNRAGQSGVPIPTPQPKGYRVTDCVFWSGRLFYLVGSTVLYSQILAEDSSNCERCYQDADPTSETISDLIDTDGGTIFIPQIGRGTRLAVIGSNLVVFGDKGIYAVAGTSNGFFSAKGYLQYSINPYGSECPRSIVVTEAGVLYWSTVGIGSITADESSGRLIVNNISEMTIQTWFSSLEPFSINNCKAKYNRSNKLVYWFYPTNPDKTRRLDSALVLDLRRGAFMKWKIADSAEDEEDFVSPQIVDMLEINTPFKSVPSITIFAENSPIYVDNLPVVINSELETFSFENVMFIALDPTSRRITFAEFYNKNFNDWSTGNVSMPDETGEIQYLNGVPFTSYLLSTAINFQRFSNNGVPIQDNYRNRQTPYMLTTFKRTEEAPLITGEFLFPSGCFGSTRWEWSDSADSFKWDSAQQLYRPETNFLNFRYVQNKTRTRGTGKAMQVYLESDGRKDFRIHDLTFNKREVSKW